MNVRPLVTSGRIARLLGANIIGRLPDEVQGRENIAAFRADVVARIQQRGFIPVICYGGLFAAWPIIPTDDATSKTTLVGNLLTVSFPCECEGDDPCDHSQCPRA